MRDVFIKGVGVHLPERVTVEWAIERGLYPAENAALHELGGAAVAGDLPAPEMARRAAEAAFSRCGHRPGDVALLLYADAWHQGPDGWQPQCYLQHHLVGGKALGVEIRLGCNGMFAAFELAASHLRADSAPRSALLVAADNFGTPLIDRWHVSPVYVAGDAASAVVLTTEPAFARLRAVRSDTVPEGEEIHRGVEPLFPPGPTVGQSLDFGARSVAFRDRATRAGGDALGVMDRIRQQLLDTVDRTLADAGINIGDVTRVAFPNYSREIVEEHCMAPLGLPMWRSTWEFGRTVGHLGASDQVVALDHLLGNGELRPGDYMLMLGTGPGVTVSCAVVEILQPAPWSG